MDSASWNGSATTNRTDPFRSIAKLFGLRFRRASSKPRDGSSVFTRSELDEEVVKRPCHETKEAMDSLISQLFAGISAVNVTYGQLQAAQAPFDPETIQSSDRAMVSELKHLSYLKHAYFSRYPETHQFSHEARIFAQIQEQRNVLRAFQITIRNLEWTLQLKDSELVSLRNALLESQERNKLLQSKLHPESSISTLGNLHLSGLNPTHLLKALRHAMSCVGTFVRQLACKIQSSNLHPLAIESNVYNHIFADFHLHHFGLQELSTSQPLDRRQFFEEFLRFKASSLKDVLDGQGDRACLFQSFCRVKFETLLQPNTDKALLMRNTGLYLCFAEMARRVWLMHLLFFSFEAEAKALMFVVPRGCRYSEVYMESVTNDDGGPATARRTVGFTVVPGFKVGKTVIQCRVYLEGEDERF